MNTQVSLVVYLIVGTLGGFIGSRLKIPAGILIGSMLAVIAFKYVSRVDWEIPRSFPFVLQVLLGITVGATFHVEMLKTLGNIIIPVIASTLLLVGAGFFLTVLFSRLGILDIGTAYLGTSPGAMSALIVLALDSGRNPTVVTCFHFFRVVFIILTMPVIYKYFFR
jgi:membrane AbrB-like protein